MKLHNRPVSVCRAGRLLAALVLSDLVPACNTMEGVGKDIEKSGEAIQRAAD